MKLNRGKQTVPLKAVIYGSEGIGKSTLASQLPDPLFIDVEGGTNQLDVLRVDENFKEWIQVEEALTEIDQELTQNPDLCKTLVVDTIDVAETLLAQEVVKDEKNPKIITIGDIPYGNGQLRLKNRIDKFLKSLDELREKHGIHIILLGHSHLKRQEKPDEQGAFDRYELKLASKVAERIKEWSDLLLFINYKTDIIKSGNKMEKNKLVGGKRVIYTTHTTAWDAKNRFGLDDELPLDIGSIINLFTVSSNPIKTQKVEKQTTKVETKEETLDDPDFKEIPLEVPVELKRLMERDSVTEDQIIDALISIGQITEFNDTANRKTKLIDLRPDFIENSLVKPWDNFLNYLKNNQ